MIFVVEYYTPAEIVSEISKYIPHNIGSLLEPAVGDGSLLTPFLERDLCELSKIVCIDIDTQVLKAFKKKFINIFNQKLKIINDDFLNWSQNILKDKSEIFDLILMNPPFDGTK